MGCGLVLRGNSGQHGGVSHPSPLTPALERAHSLVAAGDLAGAATLLERAIEIGQATLSGDDPDVLATQRELASVRHQAGDAAEARRVLEGAYAAGQFSLGDDDPLMLQISYDLGVVADELGNRAAAREAFGRVAGFGPMMLGAGHWAVTRAQAYLDQVPTAPVRLEPAHRMPRSGLTLPPAPVAPPGPAVRDDPPAPVAPPGPAVRDDPSAAAQPTATWPVIPHQGNPWSTAPAGRPPASSHQDAVGRAAPNRPASSHQAAPSQAGPDDTVRSRPASGHSVDSSAPGGAGAPGAAAVPPSIPAQREPQAAGQQSPAISVAPAPPRPFGLLPPPSALGFPPPPGADGPASSPDVASVLPPPPSAFSVPPPQRDRGDTLAPPPVAPLTPGIEAAPGTPSVQGAQPRQDDAVPETRGTGRTQGRSGSPWEPVPQSGAEPAGPVETPFRELEPGVFGVAGATSAQDAPALYHRGSQDAVVVQRQDPIVMPLADPPAPQAARPNPITVSGPVPAHNAVPVRPEPSRESRSESVAPGVSGPDRSASPASDRVMKGSPWAHVPAIDESTKALPTLSTSSDAPPRQRTSSHVAQQTTLESAYDNAPAPEKDPAAREAARQAARAGAAQEAAAQEAARQSAAQEAAAQEAARQAAREAAAQETAAREAAAREAAAREAAAREAARQAARETEAAHRAARDGAGPGGSENLTAWPDFNGWPEQAGGPTPWSGQPEIQHVPAPLPPVQRPDQQAAQAVWPATGHPQEAGPQGGSARPDVPSSGYQQEIALPEPTPWDAGQSGAGQREAGQREAGQREAQREAGQREAQREAGQWEAGALEAFPQRAVQPGVYPAQMPGGGVYHQGADGVWQGGPATPVTGGAAAEVTAYDSGGNRKRGMALFAVIAATIAAVVAVGAMVFTLAQQTRKGDDDHGQPGAPTLTGAPPGNVKLADRGTRILVGWTDPSNASVSFMVTMAHPGEQLKPVSTVGPGVTTRWIDGLNASLDYCFAVVAVYATDKFASSPQVCTERGKK